MFLFRKLVLEVSRSGFSFSCGTDFLCNCPGLAILNLAVNCVSFLVWWKWPLTDAMLCNSHWKIEYCQLSEIQSCWINVKSLKFLFEIFAQKTHFQPCSLRRYFMLFQRSDQSIQILNFKHRLLDHRVPYQMLIMFQSLLLTTITKILQRTKEEYMPR